MGASNFTNQVDNIFIFILVISVVLLIGITAAMIYFVIKYRRSKHPHAVDIHGNVLLEVVWTVVPFFIVMGFFYYGVVDYREMRNIPEDAMEVEVLGRMWSWMYTYPNGVQTDTLYVPLNKPIKLTIKSVDVIHSFYVPAFRIKQDAVPGMETKMWFKAQQEGKFQVMCAEYCGDRHAYMYSQVQVLPEAEFERWYASAGAEVEAFAEATEAVEVDKAALREKLIKQGQRLIKTKGCMACHSMDGTRLVGPSFKGIWGKTETVIANGEEKTIVVDEAYLRRSMLEPNVEIVKGYPPAMPPQGGILNEQEIQAIIEFLKTLKAEQ